MVFLGFRFGVFHFGKGFILPFAIGAAATAAAVVLLARMAVSIPRQSGHVKSHKLLFRRAYMPYYMVTLAYGCQKRIKIVFAPWVIINPVSYTHLDVYKRQTLSRSANPFWVRPCSFLNWATKAPKRMLSMG